MIPSPLPYVSSAMQAVAQAVFLVHSVVVILEVPRAFRAHGPHPLHARLGVFPRLLRGRTLLGLLGFRPGGREEDWAVRVMLALSGLCDLGIGSGVVALESRAAGSVALVPYLVHSSISDAAYCDCTGLPSNREMLLILALLALELALPPSEFVVVYSGLCKCLVVLALARLSLRHGRFVTAILPCSSLFGGRLARALLGPRSSFDVLVEVRSGEERGDDGISTSSADTSVPPRGRS